MTTTTSVTTTAAGTERRARRYLRTGLTTGLAAGVANVALVAVARAADVAVDVEGEAIPVLGFLQLTVIGALVGALLAIGAAKWAHRPRRTFVWITATLTVLSLVPDVLAETDTASKLVLMGSLVLAAAIIVPALAARLHD
jgi:hypothetical protein